MDKQEKLKEIRKELLSYYEEIGKLIAEVDLKLKEIQKS